MDRLQKASSFSTYFGKQHGACLGLVWDPLLMVSQHKTGFRISSFDWCSKMFHIIADPRVRSSLGAPHLPQQ